MWKKFGFCAQCLSSQALKQDFRAVSFQLKTSTERVKLKRLCNLVVCCVWWAPLEGANRALTVQANNRAEDTLGLQSACDNLIGALKPATLQEKESVINVAYDGIKVTVLRQFIEIGKHKAKVSVKLLDHRRVVKEVVGVPFDKKCTHVPS